MALGTGKVIAQGLDTGEVKAALLAEATDGRVLYGYNEETAYSIAGLSRLPALLVICEAFDNGELSDDTLVSVSDKASRIGGTTAFLAPGEQMRAEDMLLAAVVINAGDAIHSLACAATGSESAAIERIGLRLGQLDIQVNYSDICGTGVLLSAHDIAKIGVEILKTKSYNRFGTRYYEVLSHSTGAGDTELASSNKLLKQYSGCMGIATGSSSDAGYCGIFAATRGTTSYIAVVLGARGSADRFKLGIELLDYGFASMRNVCILKKDESFGEIAVRGGLEKSVGIVAASEVSALMSISDNQYFMEVDLPEFIEAPVQFGKIIGTVTYTDSEGNIIGKSDVIAISAVDSANLFDYIKRIMYFWIRRG